MMKTLICQIWHDFFLLLQHVQNVRTAKCAPQTVVDAFARPGPEALVANSVPQGTTPSPTLLDATLAGADLVQYQVSLSRDSQKHLVTEYFFKSKDKRRKPKSFIERIYKLPQLVWSFFFIDFSCILLFAWVFLEILKEMLYMANQVATICLFLTAQLLSIQISSMVALYCHLFLDQCDPQSGQCKCRIGWVGTECDRCALGHFGPRCRPCLCNVEGTKGCEDGVCPCDDEGRCPCKVST